MDELTRPADFDDDAFDAAVDLIGRTGAREFEVGYLHDDVPSDRADWYAHAQYHGTRIVADKHRGPVEAAEALARRLMAGGMCTHCHGTITLSSARPRKGKACRWTRRGRRWERGCAA